MDYACSFLQTPVRNAMREVISALAPDTSLAAAARLLHERHVTGAPVVDAQGHVVGVISQSDLIGTVRERSERQGHAGYYVMLHGDPQLLGTFPDLVRKPGHGLVADVMSRQILSVRPDALLREAVVLMVSQEVHRLMVIDDGRLVGVLSTMDVLRMLTPHPELRAQSGY